MDLTAIRRWKSELEQLPQSVRYELINSITPIEIGDEVATLLAAPLFLSLKTYRKIVAASEAFVDTATAIESNPVFKPGYVIYDRLYNSLSQDGKKLIDRSMPANSRAIKRRFRRLDGFLLDDQIPIFIEMNQSAPLAISFYQRAKQLAANIANKTGITINVDGDVYTDLAEWFIASLRAIGHNGDSATIAVSIERGYPAKFVDLPLACDGIAAVAKKQGINLEFILAEPTQFTWDGLRGYINSRPFDLLWRNTVYLQNYPETLVDYESIRYGGVAMVNDLQSWLFRSKDFFAILWDDNLQSELTKFGINVEKIRTMVPLTVDISQLNRENPDRSSWILKRCDDGFGKGIIFGSELTESKWTEYLSGLHGTDWIAQKVVRPLAVELPTILSDGSVQSAMYYCDIDPFVVNGGVSGILVRALPIDNAVNKKMNIVEGAAIGCAIASLN